MSSQTAHLVLAGGGHTHALLIRQWLMQPMTGVCITLISDQWQAPYSGMLPGVIAGDYSAGEAHIDLARLCKAAGITFIPARITGIDANAQQVLLAGRPALPYDWLSINTGITPSAIPGSDEHAFSLKPVSTLLSRWQSLRETSPTHIAMIGGGAAGFEMIIAIREALLRHSPNTRYSLLSSNPILQGHSRTVQHQARHVLQQHGIHFEETFRAQCIEAGRIIGEHNTAIEADAIFLATPGNAPAWVAHSGLATIDEGFIATTDTLQSTSHANVFAVGDVALQIDHPRPRAGVFAVRQAKPLFHNIRAALQEKHLHRYKPQKQFLSLLRCSPQQAIASRGVLHAQGQWVWRWKDRIDRRFMAMFSNLPAMPVTSHMLEGAINPMRCGGCGAKVGKPLLDRVLAQLADTHPAASSLHQTDDAALITPPPGMQLVQSVDGFRTFIDDPFIFGQIAAQHAVSDIHAMGAAAHSALAFVTLPHGPSRQMESTLRQLMAGILATFDAEGMQLIGGHTAEGAELSVSITANGFIAPGTALNKCGMQAGDLLVLSKPLGTGTLMAAHMQARAKGEWIEAALASMAQSNAAAASTLRERGAHAMTDITGFGLLGHLLEMCDASGCGAELYLDKLPALPGALSCLQQGIESTLAPENRRLADRISNAGAFPGHEKLALLFDPQTAGGLLAALPANSPTEGLFLIGHATDGNGVTLANIKHHS